MSSKRNYDLVYLRGSNVAHVKYYTDAFSSSCGIDGTEHGEGWFGTGTQDEHDRAARIKLCSFCAKFLDS